MAAARLLRSSIERRPERAHHDRAPPARRPVPGARGPAPHGVLGVGRCRRTRACSSACTACRARGATSTRWRARCADDYRVVCPDVVGRGRSRLAAPTRWATRSRLRRRHGHAARAAGCARTALGRHLDGRPDRPGPRVAAGLAGAAAGAQRRRARRSSPQAIAAHRHLPRRCRRTGTRSTRPPTRCWAISQGFGPHTREQWLALTRPMLVPDERGAASSRTTTRRSRCRSAPSRRELAAAGEAQLWHAYDAIRCPTLLLRGAESDLLSRDTAQAMTRARPARAPARVRRRRPRADAACSPTRSPSCANSCWPRHEDARAAGGRRGRAGDRAGGAAEMALAAAEPHEGDAVERRARRPAGAPSPRARCRRVRHRRARACARVRRAAAGRPQARHGRGRAGRTPRASRRSSPTSAPRRRCRPPPTSSTRATACSGRRRSSRRRSGRRTRASST